MFKFITRPLASNYKSQGFGQNLACIKVDSNGNAYRPFIVAGKSNNTCPIGYIEFYPYIGMKGHGGEDWAGWLNEPLYFPVDLKCEWWAKNEKDADGGVGVNIISKTKVKIDGREGFVKFRFWHLNKSNVADKETVQLGQLIAFVGNSGASSSPHLHWSMKWCDKDGNPTERNNGYHGSSDFSQWYENRFILDVLKEKEITKDIKEPQPTLIDVLNKYIFILRQNLQKLYMIK